MRPDFNEPQVPGGRRNASVKSARAFGGRAEDLDMEFLRIPRPELVSEILERCLPVPDGAARDREDVRQWTLGRRLQGLLAVTAAGDVMSLTMRQRCMCCDEVLEIPIDLETFTCEAAVGEFESSMPSGQRVHVLLPTGRHQQDWLHTGGVTIRAMARDLIRSIDGAEVPPDWEIPADWVEVIGDWLEQHDPLTALELLARCPECDVEVTIELDLEGLLLEQLQSRQMETLREIHVLASSYHWSEREILEMPVWRRRHYVRRFGLDGVV